ncbi:MAG: hypothetical protein K0R31_79 [Clostridiales bacterium]|jgi:hypothetical protein|nr:hypothetical protein [Clostridiales bacterium]MDF2987434.1 hypothetical protein [Eubacterium sp.]
MSKSQEANEVKYKVALIMEAGTVNNYIKQRVY